MNIDFGSNDIRRMPFYLLIDTSRSQEGATIQALEQVIQFLRNELLALPQAIEMVHMGVITFGGVPQDLVPLTPVAEFTAPHLEAKGATMLGGGLRLLRQALERDIISSTFDKRGDYKALVFLCVASVPEDSWQADWVDLLAQCENQLGNVIVFGCGDDVDLKSLELMTPNVLAMADASADRIRAFCRWISQPTVSTLDPRHQRWKASSGVSPHNPYPSRRKNL
jgi:uncharacterized protein YegL